MLEWTGYLNRVARWPGSSPTMENTGTPGQLSPKTVETQHSCQKLPGRRNADTAFALRRPATLRGWPACDFFGGSKPIWRQGFRRLAIRCCGTDGARGGVPGWPVPQAVSQRAGGGNLSNRRLTHALGHQRDPNHCEHGYQDLPTVSPRPVVQQLH